MRSLKARCSVLPYANTPGVCDACGAALQGRQRRWCGEKCARVHYANHRWSVARRAALRRDAYQCVTCGSDENLEVNHIIPRNGKGYGWGCWNHQDNLETLCHGCHLAVTAEQRRQRKADGGFSLT